MNFARRISHVAAKRMGRWSRSHRGPAILLYHRVAAESFDPWGLAVDPIRFEKQMLWLAANRTVLSLGDFVQRHQEGAMPADAVSITFDDGYACTANVAAPLLHGLSLPATVFLPAELIVRQREFWWDDLERIVLDAPKNQLKAGKTLIEIGPKHENDRQWLAYARPGTHRQRAYRLLWRMLRGIPDDRREAVLADMRHQAEVTARPRDSHRPMTVTEVRGLQSAQIAIGSHGLTHADLPTLDTDHKRDEIGGSIGPCTQLTGEKPRAFAYPHGRADKTTTGLVAHCGYEAAFTTESALVGSRTDRFALPRLAIGDWEIDAFRRSLRGHSRER